MGKTHKTTQKTDRNHPENRQKTAAKIIECIKNNPYINRIELSELCDISQDGIKWQLKKLQKENIIRRFGLDKRLLGNIGLNRISYRLFYYLCQ